MSKQQPSQSPSNPRRAPTTVHEFAKWCGCLLRCSRRCANAGARIPKVPRNAAAIATAEGCGRDRRMYRRLPKRQTLDLATSGAAAYSDAAGAAPMRAITRACRAAVLSWADWRPTAGWSSHPISCTLRCMFASSAALAAAARGQARLVLLEPSAVACQGEIGLATAAAGRTGMGVALLRGLQSRTLRGASTGSLMVRFTAPPSTEVSTTSWWLAASVSFCLFAVRVFLYYDGVYFLFHSTKKHHRKIVFV